MTTWQSLILFDLVVRTNFDDFMIHVQLKITETNPHAQYSLLGDLTSLKAPLRFFDRTIGETVRHTVAIKLLVLFGGLLFSSDHWEC